jgi:P4 family phage/plasmid primase-like protien
MGNVEAVYDYGDYVKVRQKGKIIRYGRVIGDEFVAGIEGIDKTIYRLSEVTEAIKNGYPVYYAEGEKDVDNLRKLGLPACTAGGCGDWRTEFAQYFKGARLVLLPDNDKPGQDLARRIEADVRDIAYSVQAVTVSGEPKGDVSDYIASGGTKDGLLNLIKAADVRYASWVRLSRGEPSGILTDVLAHSVTNSKSLDYIIVNKPGLDIAEFHIFDKGVYRKCGKNEVKGWIKRYLPLGTATDGILNNVYNLLLTSPENTHTFDKINTDESVINVKNGLVDLRERALKKHNPDVLSTLQLNCNYDEQATCPKWLGYIDTLCSDADGVVDKEKIDLLQEWTGLLLSNVSVSRTKKCLVLTSPLGNTGKSVYLSVLGHILGIDNIINIPIQKMSDRFALGDLCGKRADLVGDQTSEDIEDSSGFKQLTGGDSVKIEFKGKQSFNWHFGGGIVICCNDLPAFTDDKGGHIFERLDIIPCERVIPKDKRDGGLSCKLCKEADGIFKWALEGLYRLRANSFRFTHCKAGAAVTEAYRAKLDTFYAFITETYEVTESGADRVKKTELETAYIDWCKNNDYTALNKKNIKDRAAKNGVEVVKYCGNLYYRGLKPKLFSAEETDSPIPEEFNW